MNYRALFIRLYLGFRGVLAVLALFEACRVKHLSIDGLYEGLVFAGLET